MIPDWFDFAVCLLLGLLAFVGVMLYVIAIVLIRGIRPRDWMPVEVWTAAALLGTLWAAKCAIQ